MSYQSANTGAQIDAAVTLSSQNKSAITTINSKIESYRRSVDIAATFAPGVAQELTVAVAGAVVGDPILLYSTSTSQLPTGPDGEVLHCNALWVSASGQVTLRFVLLTGEDPVEFDFTMMVLVMKLGTT